MKFSVGYTPDNSFFNVIIKYSSNISSVYFPLPSSLGSAGRAIEQENDYTKNIIKLITICNKYGIDSILLFNGGCEGKNTGDKTYLVRIITYLKELAKIGLTSVSISNLVYVPIIKKICPEIKIYSSVNCNLNTVEQALYFKDIGVDVLTIYRDINRDLELIKKIKEKSGLETQIILNESCIRACPYYETHSNIQTHDIDTESNLIQEYGCSDFFGKNKKSFFRIPFVRPEDLYRYNGIVDYYKLSTRGLSCIDIENMLKAYIKEKYDGNLLDILDVYQYEFVRKTIGIVDNTFLGSQNFFDKIKNCPGDCDNCNICNSFFK